MFRVFFFFTAILLLSNMMPISLAQQDSVETQAKADASTDMSDRSKTKFFLLGGVGSTVGFLLGCIGGCLLGGANFSDGPSNNQACFDTAGAIVLGVFAVPTAVFVYLHNPTPPPERLLGKSPEYIQAYTQVYKSRTVFLRKIFVTAGSITSNLGVMTTSVIIFLYGMGQHPVE